MERGCGAGSLLASEPPSGRRSRISSSEGKDLMSLSPVTRQSRQSLYIREYSYKAWVERFHLMPSNLSTAHQKKKTIDSPAVPVCPAIVNHEGDGRRCGGIIQRKTPAVRSQRFGFKQ